MKRSICTLAICLAALLGCDVISQSGKPSMTVLGMDVVARTALTVPDALIVVSQDSLETVGAFEESALADLRSRLHGYAIVASPAEQQRCAARDAPAGACLIVEMLSYAERGDTVVMQILYAGAGAERPGYSGSAEWVTYRLLVRDGHATVLNRQWDIWSH